MVKAKDLDKKARIKPAKAAVQLSLTWAPVAGLAQGLLPDDPLMPMVREVRLGRLSLFEPTGVWEAINNWRAWEAYLANHPTNDAPAAHRVMLAGFVQGHSAATGPLVAWNKFDFVKRHLKADIPLADVAKPAKGPGSDGVVRQNQQAVAMPPEFLMAYETALERMVAASDWRRGPLAVSLEVAYALVRLVHMGRSQFTHMSDVSFWLAAYRGKGKREGARRAFTWAMLRLGLTNFDVGKVIYDIWLHWSKSKGFALDYVAMGPETGTKMESHHVQAVMRSVAEGFLVGPKQASLVQPCSNRRFGWAGVPHLAKITTDASAVLTAWKRSMPHLYCYTRSEDEERQKLLHLAMLRLLAVELSAVEGPKAPATWEAIRRVSVAEVKGGRVMAVVRKAALTEVAQDLKGTTLEDFFGTTAPPRRQFTVTFLRQKVAVRKFLARKQQRSEVKQERPSLQIPLGVSVGEEATLPIASPGAPLALPQQIEAGASPGRGTAPTSEEEVATEVLTAVGTGDQGTAEAPQGAQQTPEWVCSIRSKYLRQVTLTQEGLFTACRWRKGPSQRKPINPDRILWRGDAEGAKTAGIHLCPDAACRAFGAARELCVGSALSYRRMSSTQRVLLCF